MRLEEVVFLCYASLSHRATPHLAGRLASYFFEDAIEGGFGIEAGFVADSEQGVVRVVGLLQQADGFLYSVFVDIVGEGFLQYAVECLSEEIRFDIELVGEFLEGQFGVEKRAFLLHGPLQTLDDSS